MSISIRRTIGKMASPVSISSSYLILLAYGILFALKDWSTGVQVPKFDLSLYEITLNWMPFLFGAWIVSNMLSGRWAPVTLVGSDRFSSLVVFLGTVAIAGYAFLATEIALDYYGWFGIVPILAFIDWWFAKSEEYRSSQLRQTQLSAENVQLRNELESATVANERLVAENQQLQHELHAAQARARAAPATATPAAAADAYRDRSYAERPYPPARRRSYDWRATAFLIALIVAGVVLYGLGAPEHWPRLTWNSASTTPVTCVVTRCGGAPDTSDTRAYTTGWEGWRSSCSWEDHPNC